MAKRILLIDHHENQQDDRVFVHLNKLGVQLDLRRPFAGDELPKIDDNIIGAVIYGGAQSVNDTVDNPFLETEIQWIRNAIDYDLPTLGICLGAQLIAHTLGAAVTDHEQGLCEFGYYKIEPTEHAEGWLSNAMLVTQAHYQQFDLPQGAISLATGENFPNQAFRYKNNIYGIQFHPEVTADIFKRWQNSEWAFYHKPGAQAKIQQTALMDAADKIQEPWFHGFLENLFQHALQK